MKSTKTIATAFIVILFISSCSVQQFAVNTNTKPFENGGRVWGEKIRKCGEGGWEKEARKTSDIHVLGINVKRSDTKKLAEELNASAYTIETKSNLWISLLTSGMVDYKVVKVIKRNQ